MRFRWFSVITVVLSFPILQGCLETSHKAAFRGDHAQVIAQHGGGALYQGKSMGEVHQFCIALLETRIFNELNRCVSTLEAMVAGNGGRLVIDAQGLFHVASIPLARAFSKGHLLDLKMRSAFYRGSLEEAHGHASTLAALTAENLYERASREGEGDENEWDYPVRMKHYMNALGILGIIESRWNNPEAARTQADALAALDVGGFIGSRGSLPEIRASWASQVLLALEDYERAYEAAVSSSDTSLGGVLFSAVEVINVINPAAYAALAATSGSADPEVLSFALEFEPRFVRYRAALETGRLAEAERGYDKILNDRRIENFGSVHWRALHGRGLIYRRKGDPGQAIARWKQAVDVIEAQRTSLEAAAGRMSFVADKQQVYRDLVEALVEQGRLDEAFNYVERAKSRALVDMLASRRSFGGGDANTAALLNELTRLESQSILGASQGSAGPKERSAAIARTKAAIRTASPELASLISVETLEAPAVRASLGPSEALVEYFGHGSTYFAFVLTRNTISAVALDGTGLPVKVRRFRRDLQRSQTARYMQSAQALYNSVLRPIAGQLRGIDQLTIVPHGTLHYLPFAALNDGGRYLVERYTMRLLPSATVLKFLDKGTQSELDLLAFGNPDLGDPQYDLPGAEEETRVIDQDWQGTKVLLREFATEANFKRFAPAFRYLHLASHGEFDADQPLQSRMLLAGGDGEDGSLTVDELYGLRLNAEMVVLSACETGLGDVERGDDVIGLNRGFLYAGAQSIVSSLWPVSDEATAHMMKAFYANLKTLPRASALRAAMLSTKEAYPHPLFWSAFNLSGAT